MTSSTEFLIIVVLIIFLFIAPKQISNFARSLGEGVRAIQKVHKDARSTPPESISLTPIMIAPAEEPLLVFVSSSMDEFSELRPIVKDAIQRIPLTKPWLFEFTPSSSEKVEPLFLNKVDECDIFILLVGETISPPVLKEYGLAVEKQKPCLIFLKDCKRNEEAQSFVGKLEIKWSKFSRNEELAHLVQTALVDELIKGYREGSLKKLSEAQFAILISMKELLDHIKSRKLAKEKKPASKDPNLQKKDLTFFAISPLLAIQYEKDVESFISEKKYKEAIELLSKLIFLNPNENVIFLRATCYDKISDGVSAIQDYSAVIEINPRYENIFLKRGDDYFSLHQHNRAISDFSYMIQLEPSNVDAYIRRASVHKVIKQYKKAIDDFNEIIKIEPNKIDHYLERGQLWENIKQYDMAIDDYGEITKIDPENANAYYKRGLLFDHLKIYDEAIRNYSYAINCFSEQKRDLLGWFLELANPSENVISKTISSKTDCFLKRGDAYSKLEMYPEAIYDYEIVLSTDQNDLSARMTRAKLDQCYRAYRSS